MINTEMDNAILCIASEDSHPAFHYLEKLSIKRSKSASESKTEACTLEKFKIRLDKIGIHTTYCKVRRNLIILFISGTKLNFHFQL